MPAIRPAQARMLALAMIAGGIFVLVAAAVLSTMGDVPGLVPALVAGVGVLELLFGVMLLVKKGTNG